eukprot:gene16872-biopygen13183
MAHLSITSRSPAELRGAILKALRRGAPQRSSVELREGQASKEEGGKRLRCWEALESLGAPELRKSQKPWKPLGRPWVNLGMVWKSALRASERGALLAC